MKASSISRVHVGFFRSPGRAGSWLRSLLGSIAPLCPPRELLVPSCRCSVTNCSFCFRFSLPCTQILLLATLVDSAACRAALIAARRLYPRVTPGAVLEFLRASSCTAPMLRDVGLFCFSRERPRLVADYLVSGVAGAASSCRIFPLSSSLYLTLHVLVLLTPCPLQW